MFCETNITKKSYSNQEIHVEILHTGMQDQSKSKVSQTIQFKLEYLGLLIHTL